MNVHVATSIVFFGDQHWVRIKDINVHNIGSCIISVSGRFGHRLFANFLKQKNEVATKAELTRAFKKHMGSKMTNKTILNAFIEQIA